MSKNLQNNPVSEEIDLGKLFSYIEKLFKKIGDLIYKMLKFLVWLLTKLGIFVLIIIKIVKTHFIKIGIAGLLTFGVFHLLAKTSPPVYESNIIIKQNYPSGNLLYDNISKINRLASTKDSIGLGKQLGIPSENAAKLIAFKIVDFMNENDLREKYYKYIKDIDSTMLISFGSYRVNYDLENYPLHSITVASKTPDAFNGLSQAIIKSFETNAYFIEEKERGIALINNQMQTQKEILKSSNNLQEQYVKLLEKYYGAEEDPLDPQNMTINLNMSNAKDKINTREYELFEEQSKIKLELVSLENSLKEKEQIIRLQKDFSSPIILNNFYNKYKIVALIIAMGLVILFFLIKEFKFIEVLDKYGNKENLMN